MKFRFIGLGVLLIVAGISLRVFFALPFAQGLLRDEVANQQLSIASYVARDIDHSIQARRALIGELSTALPPELLQQPEKLATWVRERQRVNPLFNSGLLVLRPDGNGLLAEYPAIAGRSNLVFSEIDWFQAALHADSPVMSKPERGRANGEPILIMAAPVRNAARQVVAVLAGVVVLNTPGFLDRLQEVRLGASGGFLLVSPADKLFVAASDPAMVLAPTPAAGVNLLHDRAMAGFRGTGITINAKGVEELSSMVTVPSTGWFVVARIPTAEVFHPIQAMRNFFLKNTLVVLFGTIAILMLVLPRLLRPLTSAAQAMREMADGTRPLAPLPVRRRDEVGDLVLGFNYLVERLYEKEAALKASEASMAFMAHHDALTGLYNRTMLEDRLQQAVVRAQREGSHFALLFCDLDDFKPINDQYGHAAGDGVLHQVAARLLDERRGTDTVARLGGDEFVILLTDLSDAHSGAIVVAQQLLETLSIPFNVGGKIFELSASIGIALYPGIGVSASQLMSQADIAMYRAKRAGKNKFCVFDETFESFSI
ncbi:diguanylate cyclase (GGDEF) domain-containing protein [Collimonas sp. OK242]|uniref:diguanylate cyclase domain-containing protein n=1 Tax=Collimonas sp. OK242 TaxID=1798195 RepID=UPI000895153C|nr:diguanylate cyclase [Collimonas sp. OK242]SDX19567.1 diguanylate cyclase (GGDEF) domain-containing protein [Collimonas sp. OK242]